MALKTVLLLCVLCQIAQSLSETHVHYIGNDIVLRRYAYTTVGVPFATFLMDRPLPEGVLRSILFFSHSELPDAERSLGEYKRCVWLQLFKRLPEQHIHQLKWQDEVCMGDNYNSNYTATMAFPVHVGQNYYLGWTCGKMFCPISYSEEPGSRESLQNIGRFMSTPTVGSFLSLGKAKDYVWSVGANVETDIIWTTTTTTLAPISTEEASTQGTVPDAVNLPLSNTTSNDTSGWIPNADLAGTVGYTDKETTETTETTAEVTTAEADDTEMVVPMVIEFDYKPMFFFVLVMAVTLGVLVLGSFVLFKYVKARRPKDPQVVNYTPYPPQMTSPQAFYPQQVSRVEKLALDPDSVKDIRDTPPPAPAYSFVPQNIQLLPPMTDVAMDGQEASPLHE